MFGNKLERLKQKARKHYNIYRNELDQMSCGAAIGELMNPRMSAAKQAFNETMDELSKLDTSCPVDRL